MRRLADGHREAFDDVFDQLWPALKQYVGRWLPDPGEREDAAQAALLKIFAQATDFDRARDAAAWAFTIAAYEALTLRRRAGRRREVFGIPLDGLTTAADPESAILQAEVAAALAELLQNAPEQDRIAVLTDVSTQGASHDKDTWRKRRQRALTRFRETWRRVYGAR
jgi:DNA-directed RNA polymerase specialized sigma24 family protein